MLTHFRNISNLNERLAYNLIGKLRKFVMVVFNNFLYRQEKRVRKQVSALTNEIEDCLIEILPSVDGITLKEVLTTKESEYIVKAANEILAHKFTIFSTTIVFEDNLEWHLDFNSGFRWPKGKIYTQYNQVDVKTNADVKFPREFSRCHHFLILGEAYLITKDEKYCEEFIYQVKDWIRENPYKKSINWGCSMDIAIRASNWIYSLRMFLNSEKIETHFLNDIFTSLYLHGRFIYENPEKNRVYNHNHYLSDLAGQILIGVLFKDPKFDEAKLWKEYGIYELFREIRVQILPTGFSYERTTNYHRLVTELIVYTVILLKRNNIEVPQDIMYRIKKMFKVILNYSFKDGTAPIIGDQDNGRYLPFFQYNINFQKYLLNIGASLFNDGIFKSYSSKNNIDVLFLLGKEGLEIFEKTKIELIQQRSKSFSDAGFYILRSDKVFVFINNSGLSHYNEVKGGTHTHSDLLSFVYEFDGIPFLIDPGTFVYSSNPKERMKFRSTAMHNTLTVEDYDQNELSVEDLWSIKRDAIPKEILWFENEDIVIFEGNHSGFERLANPMSHSRSFRLDKETNNLRIIDKLIGEGKHSIKCHFHFDLGVSVKVVDNVVYCEKNQKKIKIWFNVTEDFLIEQKEDYISKSYNNKTVAPYLQISLEIIDSSEIITNIQSEN